jgi:hypothetical protein
MGTMAGWRLLVVMTAKLDRSDDSWGGIAVLLVGDGGVAGEGGGLRGVN